jgi:tape measure domain-containing protein
MASLALAFDILARDRASRVFHDVGDAVESTGRKGEGLGSRLSGGLALAGRTALGLVGGLATVGAAGGGMGLAVAAGNEQAQIAFETMLDSADKAGAFLKDLQAFAAKTPFEFPELQTAASSLISAGFEAKQVIPIMTTLGDVTSGMGTGSEGVQRATVALQQMQAAGRITAEDLNQLRDAGIPVYDLLAKATGKSKEEVVKLASAGKLGKKELGQMMAALESGKGLERFTGLMEKQSQSLSGMWSTFKDTLGQGLASAIQPLIPMIKDGLAGASEFLGKALAVVAGVLPKVVSGFIAVKDVVVKVLSAFQILFSAGGDAQGFGEVLDNALGNTGKFVAPLRAVGDVIRELVNGVKGFFGALQNGDVTSDGFVGAMERIAVFVRNDVIPAVMGIVSAIQGFIAVALPIVQQFVAGMQARIEPLMPKIREIFGTIGEIVTAAMELVRAVIERVTTVISWIWTNWGQGIMNFLSAVWSGVIGIVGPALDVIRSVIQTVTSLIKGDWGKAWDGLKGIVAGAWGLIKGIVTGAIGIIKQVLSAAWGAIQSAASGAWNGFKSVIASAFDAVKTAVSTKIGEVVKFVALLPARAVAALGNIAGSLVSAGSNLIGGFIQGIKARAGEVIATIRNFITDKIPDFIKNALGIHSPSVVMMRLGASTAEGMALGIASGARQIDKAAQSLVPKVSPASSPYAGDSGSGGRWLTDADLEALVAAVERGASRGTAAGFGYQADEVAMGARR